MFHAGVCLVQRIQTQSLHHLLAVSFAAIVCFMLGFVSYNASRLRVCTIFLQSALPRSYVSCWGLSRTTHPDSEFAPSSCSQLCRDHMFHAGVCLVQRIQTQSLHHLLAVSFA